MTDADPASPGGGEPSFTPQGFLVEAEEGGEGGWKSVLIARTGLPPTGTPQRLLGFGAPEPAIQAMLEANELFAVIADPTRLGAQAPGDFGTGGPTFANGLWLGPWPLSVAVGSSEPPDYSNVTLIKHRVGKLRDLVADPALWSGSDLAAEDPSSLSAWIGAYLDEACRKAGNDPLYRPFAELVEDEGFAGILVLRPSLDLHALPEEMAALPSWLGTERLHAHHCGVSYGDPRYVGVFGAIDHQPAAGGDPGSAGGGLSLASVRAQFRYSDMVGFDCRVAARPADTGLVAPVLLKGGYSGAQGRRGYLFEPAGEAFALGRSGDSPRPLDEWFLRIEPVLTGWLGPAASVGGTFEFRLTYEYPLSPGGISTSLPVLMVPPSPLSNVADLLRSAARQAGSWLEEMAPPAMDARFSLAASVQSHPSCEGFLRATLPAFTLSLDRVAKAQA